MSVTENHASVAVPVALIVQAIPKVAEVLDLQLAVLAANLADYESGFAFPGTSMAVYLGRSDACVDGCRFPWTRMDCNSSCNWHVGARRRRLPLPSWV
jgi:hypothetical protein